MKQIKIWFTLCLLGLLVSGCQIFPYAAPPPAEESPNPAISTPIVQPDEPNASQEPTQSLPDMSPTDDMAAPLTEPIAPDASEEATPGAQTQYILQEGTPVYLPNFTQPEAGCEWLGIAGQVFDANGVEMLGLIVHAGSALEGEESELTSITGQEQAYGLGGFEIQVSDVPIDSSDIFWVQVFDPDGKELTERIFLDTFEDCEQNLILVNFVPNLTSVDDKSVITPAATPTEVAYP